MTTATPRAQQTLIGDYLVMHELDALADGLLEEDETDHEYWVVFDGDMETFGFYGTEEEALQDARDRARAEELEDLRADVDAALDDLGDDDEAIARMKAVLALLQS